MGNTARNCSALDRKDILSRLFYPRRDSGTHNTGATDVHIPVDKGVEIGGRFHMAGLTFPNILFFHGNGEIVSDYDDVAPAYNQIGVNFLAVDYRGYGRSGGEPTVSAMMRDCGRIYAFVRGWLERNRHSGPILVMGRSLGSASAIELAAANPQSVRGLIIESGFAFIIPLLRLIGANAGGLGPEEEKALGNFERIKAFRGPTLIIHGELDRIIPYSDAQALFDASPAEDKTLLKIEGADHNDVFYRGAKKYMNAVKDFVDRVAGGHGVAGVRP